jgi:hypothetical protein
LRFLAAASWKAVGLIAAAWAAAWLLLQALGIWLDLRRLELSAGDRVAAIGFGITWRGAIVTFGPPIVLVILRLVLARLYVAEPPSNEANKLL